MSLDHAADPSPEAERFLDAVEDLCDHYGVTAESKYAELPSEAQRASKTRAVKPRADPAGKVHYLTAGEGPPLLLLHGLSTTGASWIPVFDALTDQFTVYAPDRPGRGLSTAVDYRETGFREFGVSYLVDLLDALGIEQTAVMGNSLGGFQTLALTLDHPERVTRQCLIGAPAGLSTDLPLFFRILDLPLVGDWLFDYFEAESVEDARRAYRQMNVEDDSAIPDAYLRPGVVGESLPGQRRSLRSLMETLGSVRGMNPQFDLSDDLPGVETPTRFVWGTEDYFWPPAVGRRVVAEMPDADLVVLEGHGHTPWLEPGDEAIDATVAFLADE